MDFFSALANPLRIAILQSLLEKEKNVSQLVEDIGEERTLVSHNLAQLLNVNLVSFQQAGKERIYCVNEEIVAPLFYLLENFVCKGCSFRKSCKVMQKKGLRMRAPVLQRETCAGCGRN